MSFRVRVDLSQVFSDERAKVFVFIPDRRKCVSWLVSRLGQLVGAPKDIALMVDDHLLPNEETLEVLQIGDRVSAIPGNKKHIRMVLQEQQVVDEESHEPIPSSWEPQEKRQHLIEACLMNNTESLQKVKQQALHLLKQFQTVPQKPIQEVPTSDVTDFCNGSSSHNYEQNQNVAASSVPSENFTEEKVRRRRRRVRRRKVPATDFTVTEIPAQMETELDVDHVDFNGETTATASEMEVSDSKQSNLHLQQEKDIDSEQDEDIQEEVNEEERSNSGNDQSPLQPSMPYGRLIASV